MQSNLKIIIDLWQVSVFLFLFYQKEGENRRIKDQRHDPYLRYNRRTAIFVALAPPTKVFDFQLDNMQLVTLANLPEGLSDVINSLQVVESRVEGRVRAPLLLKDIPNLEKLGT